MKYRVARTCQARQYLRGQRLTLNRTVAKDDAGDRPAVADRKNAQGDRRPERCTDQAHQVGIDVEVQCLHPNAHPENKRDERQDSKERPVKPNGVFIAQVQHAMAWGIGRKQCSEECNPEQNARDADDDNHLRGADVLMSLVKDNREEKSNGHHDRDTDRFHYRSGHQIGNLLDPTGGFHVEHVAKMFTRPSVYERCHPKANTKKYDR